MAAISRIMEPRRHLNSRVRQSRRSILSTESRITTTMLEEDRTLVRTRKGEDGCFVTSLAKPTGDRANYLILKDPEGLQKNEGENFVFSYANELSAPLVGIMSVRQSHGTIAAEELALAICQKKNEVKQETQNALDRKSAAEPYSLAIFKIGPEVRVLSFAGGERVVSADTHFSHMAMCEQYRDLPLGWVLSERTRRKIEKDLLVNCGNKEQLSGLEKALGLRASAPSSVATNRGE
jgi:hypothetical protein